jgi:hypothetical protein
MGLGFWGGAPWVCYGFGRRWCHRWVWSQKVVSGVVVAEVVGRAADVGSGEVWSRWRRRGGCDAIVTMGGGDERWWCDSMSCVIGSL